MMTLLKQFFNVTLSPSPWLGSQVLDVGVKSLALGSSPIPWGSSPWPWGLVNNTATDYWQAEVRSRSTNTHEISWN